MENTDKAICRELASLLVAHGVENVVLSPGSRNAPMVLAVTRNADLAYRVVIDERCAAFIALGMAAQSRRAVALVCTSGTAMLNYAPAIAEAYYREIPLIVITADRPQEWIDQDDSQTIRQPGILDHIVRKSVNLPVETGSATQMWMVNRLVNDALSAAVENIPGPVHINLQLDLPLASVTDVAEDYVPRLVQVTTPSMTLPVAQVRAMAEELRAPRRVMLVCGFMPPSQKISRAVNRLAALPNVVVLTEAQANIHAAGVISNIDRVLASMDCDTKVKMAPDVVITVGGSLVSRFIKGWLRKRDRLEHWHVGIRGISVDAFMHMTRRIEINPESFLPQLASAMQPNASLACDYRARWQEINSRAAVRHNAFVDKLAWCDLSAMSLIMKNLPDACNLQASNGTSVRYVQLFNHTHLHRIDSNRGVSGIDGCTSTAIGGAIMYKGGPTVLITGDMSMQYDIGALATNDMPRNFHIIVLNNGGGGIFRFLKHIAALPEVDECFAAHVNLPVRQLAEAYGFKYNCANSPEELQSALTDIYGSEPTILDVRTDGQFSADILNAYFKFLSE